MTNPSDKPQKFTLIGIVEPATEDLVEAFNQWYLGNHVEDTYRAPVVTSARILRATKSFLDFAPPGAYIALYEMEGESAAGVEAALLNYQQDPAGWSERQPNNGSLGVIGAGFYEEVLSFGP